MNGRRSCKAAIAVADAILSIPVAIRRIRLHLSESDRLGLVYLSTVLDDFSRYIVAWKLCATMRALDVPRRWRGRSPPQGSTRPAPQSSRACGIGQFVRARPLARAGFVWAYSHQLHDHHHAGRRADEAAARSPAGDPRRRGLTLGWIRRRPATSQSLKGANLRMSRGSRA